LHLSMQSDLSHKGRGDARSRVPGLSRCCCCARNRHHPRMRVMTTESLARSYSTNTPSHSRGAVAPEVCLKCFAPIEQRAWGMPGARCTRSLAWDKNKPHERSHHGRTGFTRHSRTRMVLTVSFVLFPAIGPVVTVADEIAPANLTPASRRQNHTTLPSALASFVYDAAASIAFHPDVSDDGQRPS
jgi:hypothetical protein